MNRATEIAAMPKTPSRSKLKSRPGAWLVPSHQGVLMRWVDEQGGKCFLQSLDGSKRYGWFEINTVSVSQNHTVTRVDEIGKPLRYDVQCV